MRCSKRICVTYPYCYGNRSECIENCKLWLTNAFKFILDIGVRVWCMVNKLLLILYSTVDYYAIGPTWIDLLISTKSVWHAFRGDTSRSLFGLWKCEFGQNPFSPLKSMPLFMIYLFFPYRYFRYSILLFQMLLPFETFSVVRSVKFYLLYYYYLRFAIMLYLELNE